jgi:ATP-binding cassette subfamily B protein
MSRNPFARGSFLSRLVRVIGQLRPQIRAHRRLLVVGTLGTLIVVACRLAFPWPLRGILEVAFDTPDAAVASLVPSSGDPMLWLGGAFLAIVVAQGIGELVQRLSFARFSIGVVHDLRTQALARLERGANDPGDVIARVIGDSARFKSGLKGVLIRLTQNGTYFVGVCVMLTIIDPELGLVFTVGGTIILVLAIVGASRVARVSRRLRKREGQLAGRMHEALLDRGPALDDVVEESERRAARAEAKTTRMEGTTMLGVHALLGLTTVAVLALGLDAVQAGRLSAGDMFTVLFYLVQVHNPMVRLGRQAVRLGRVLASAERLIKLTHAPAPAPAAAPAAPTDDTWAHWGDEVGSIPIGGAR